MHGASAPLPKYMSVTPAAAATSAASASSASSSAATSAAHVALTGHAGIDPIAYG